MTLIEHCRDNGAVDALNALWQIREPAAQIGAVGQAVQDDARRSEWPAEGIFTSFTRSGILPAAERLAPWVPHATLILTTAEAADRAAQARQWDKLLRLIEDIRGATEDGINQVIAAAQIITAAKAP